MTPMNPLAPLNVPHHEVIQPPVNDVLVAVIQNLVGRLEVLLSQEGLHPSPDQILAVTNRVMEWDSPAITPTERRKHALELLDSLDQ